MCVAHNKCADWNWCNLREREKKNGPLTTLCGASHLHFFAISICCECVVAVDGCFFGGTTTSNEAYKTTTDESTLKLFTSNGAANARPHRTKRIYCKKNWERQTFSSWCCGVFCVSIFSSINDHIQPDSFVSFFWEKEERNIPAQCRCESDVQKNNKIWSAPSFACSRM